MATKKLVILSLGKTTLATMAWVARVHASAYESGEVLYADVVKYRDVFCDWAEDATATSREQAAWFFSIEFETEYRRLSEARLKAKNPIREFPIE